MAKWNPSDYASTNKGSIGLDNRTIIRTIITAPFSCLIGDYGTGILIRGGGICKMMIL